MRWFLRGNSARAISYETGLHRQRVMRALRIVRLAMLKDVPETFSGTVEIDDTYLGGERKNLRHSKRKIPGIRGRGTQKTPVFGILCRAGTVWAQVVPDIQAKTILPLLRRQVKAGSEVCSDTWQGYTGVAARGYVHRLVNHTNDTYVSATGTHINGLEGFWGYLKRQLAAKGGIRRERLPLYLAEYIWRYNHRRMDLLTQARKLERVLYHYSSEFGG